MATNAAPLNTAARSPSLSKQPKYYEADGALRAYANISVWAAVIAGVVGGGNHDLHAYPATHGNPGLADWGGNRNWFGRVPQNDYVAFSSERNSGGSGTNRF